MYTRLEKIATGTGVGLAGLFTLNLCLNAQFRYNKFYLTGSEFNEKYKEKKFFKLTDENDYIPAKVNKCRFIMSTLLDIHGPDEIEFTDYVNFSSIQNKKYIREITIPDDAGVRFREFGNSRASKLILGERKEINPLDYPKPIGLGGPSGTINF